MIVNDSGRNQSVPALPPEETMNSHHNSFANSLPAPNTTPAKRVLGVGVSKELLPMKPVIGLFILAVCLLAALPATATPDAAPAKPAAVPSLITPDLVIGEIAYEARLDDDEARFGVEIRA